MRADVVINGKTLSYASIAQGRWVADAYDAYEQAVLRLIQRWLSGCSSFSLTTSGTTGSPQRHTFSRSQLTASAHATLRRLDVPTTSPFFVCISVYHAGGTMQLIRALCCAAPLCVVTPSSCPLRGESVAYALASLVPLQLHEIFSRGEAHRLEQIHSLLVGGGCLSPQLDAQLRSLQRVRVYESFGMTETASHIALRRINGRHAQQHFHLLPGIAIATDEHDCLLVRGRITNNQTIRTRDVVRLVDAKGFSWVGRVDDIVSSGGVKISLAWLEHRIQDVFASHGYHHWLHFCYALSHAGLGEAITLFIAAEDAHINQNTPPDARHLRLLLREALPVYAVPRAIHFVSEVVYTSTYKVNKSATVAKFFGHTKRSLSPPRRMVGSIEIPQPE